MNYSQRQALELAGRRTYIDLFAGCGGLSLGLGKAGWSGLFAVEKDPMAFETFQRNLVDASSAYAHFSEWPDWLPIEPLDICEMLEDEQTRLRLLELRGTVSLVAGGPPCQGFSVGGARNGLDPRNQLAFRMLDFVDLVKPAYVLIENVEGIERPFMSRPGHHEDSIANLALARLQRMGYSVTRTTLSATDFGVPQTRRRVVMFGALKMLVGDADIRCMFEDALGESAASQLRALGLPLDRPVNISEALDDLAGTRHVVCPDAPRFDTSLYETPTSTYAVMMRRGLRDGTVPDSHRLARHTDKLLALFDLAHTTQRSGRLPKAFLLENNTKSNKKFLLDPERPASTVTTHPDEFIHHKHSRIITLREMARIQSFPDDFTFHGRYTLNGDRRGLDVSRCAQIGNAIPPLVGMAIGSTLDMLTARLGQVREAGNSRSEVRVGGAC